MRLQLAGLRCALWVLLCAVLFNPLWATPAWATQPDTVRVGLLRFGTVNWEVAVMQSYGLPVKHGVALEVSEFASSQAAAVALQAGKVDVIVSDWLWVLEQRQQRRYAYYPYSTAIGGMRLAPGVQLGNLAQCQGLRLGVAGGATDKSWRVFQAYAQQNFGVDLADSNQIKYAAPPLLNQLLIRGELDAVINYWHFNARLSGRGAAVMAETQQLLQELVGSDAVPMLGWVFGRDWAEARPARINGFLAASAEAKALLAESDEAWQRIAALLKTEDQAQREALIGAYRSGIPEAFSEGAASAIARVYELLEATPGASPVAKAATGFDWGIFWWRPGEQRDS